MAGGDILTEGETAHGIFGEHQGSGGIDIDMTGGDILTESNQARGIFGKHEGSGAVTIDMTGGSIETSGNGAQGIYGEHEGSGALTLTMSGGAIEVNGESGGFLGGGDPAGLFGKRIGSGSGDLTINMTSGTIKVGAKDENRAGYSASGIVGQLFSSSTGDLAVNMSGGTIQTGFGTGTNVGRSAEGIYASNVSGDNGNMAVTLSGGSIHTKGSHADGIGMDVNGTQNLTATITLSGGSIDTEGLEADGIYATVAGQRGIKIELTDAIAAGTCTSADSSGCDIHTQQNRSVGVHAVNSGSGEIEIAMAGGDILTQGTNAHGIHANRTGSGNTDIDMTGGSITTTGSGARGLYVQHTSSGTLDPVVVEGGTISAAQAEAIYLEATPAKSLALRNATITRGNTGNAIGFSGSADDTLTVLGGTGTSAATTTIRGAVAFGGGSDDRLIFSTCRTSDIGETGNACVGQEASAGDLTLDHTGAFTGLESISKIGSGELRLAGLSAAGAAMALEDGDLRLTGHLNLGTGNLTVHDTTRLIFGATSATAFGRITASQVKFDDNDWQKLYLANGAHSLLDGKDVLVNDSGSFVDSAGSEITAALKLYNEAGTEIGTVASGSSTDNDGTVTLGVAPTPAPDNNECGAAPSGGGTITCDETTYIYQYVGPVAPADAGIEYSALSGANDYTINLSGTIDVDATDDDDHGLHVQHSSGGIDIDMTGGDILTEGDQAHGIFGEHTGSGAVTIDLTGGSIETSGDTAPGIYGEHEGSGALTLTMSGGAIEVNGESGGLLGGGDPAGLFGKRTGTGSGDLTINMSGGTIKVGAKDENDAGNSASGIVGQLFSSSTGDLAVNMSGGTIQTGFGTGTNVGRSAEGIYASNVSGVNGNMAVTLSGGSIHTKGSHADGIGMDVNATQDLTATITMSGGSIDTEGLEADGIYATVSGERGIEIELTDDIDAGTCTSADSSGCDIHTRQNRSVGVHAVNSGSGKIEIAVAGGDILTQGTDAHGIHANRTGSGTLDIDLTGGSITTTGSGARGLYVQHTSSGTLDHVVVKDSAVSAAQAEAIYLGATPAKSLTLRNSTIERGNTGNAIGFSGSTDDTLTVLGGTDTSAATTTIRGAVAFGGGSDDRLIFSTCRTSDIGETGNACVGQEASAGDLALSHTGAFTGLEKISKIGSGTLRLSDLDASGAAMALEDGDLRLTGHLDLGSGGLTIHDATRLIFGATSATAFGRITASQVKFNDNDWQKLYLANGSHSLLHGKDVLVNDSGSFVDSAGNEITAVLKLHDEAGSEIGTVASGDSTVSDGVVALASAPAPVIGECGDAVGGTINCDEDDQSSAGDGIDYSFSDSSDYTINFGGTLAVTTTSSSDQDPGFGISGVHSGGDLTINMSGGSIDTSGDDAHGIRGLFADSGSSTLAIKMSGGTIDTNAASGILGAVYRGNHLDIDLTGAIPAGTCNGTTNTGCDIHTTGDFGYGMYIVANPTNDGIQPTGNVAVDMAGGDILTEGRNSAGIYSRNYGSGSLEVGMSGGSIRTEGTDAHGIYSRNDNGSRLTVSVTGGTIRTTGSGARGIYVVRTGSGALDPVVVEDSTISTAQADAITLDAVPAKSLTLRNSTIERGNAGNAIWYRGSTDDTLTILGGTGTSAATTTIGGDVAFGGGTADTLLFNTCLQSDVDDTTDTDCTAAYGDLKLSHTGELVGLESIRKIGSGAARLTDLSASGAMMSLADGDLRLAGHLDLGTGNLTIYDTSRLIFGKTDTNHGRITASQVKFAADNWWKLFMEAGALEAGNDVLVNGDGRFRNNDGDEVAPMLSSETGGEVGLMVASDGTISAASPPDPDPGVLAGHGCGDLRAKGGAIACDETTWTRGSDADDDPIIEYSFSGDGAYTIEFTDNPGDDRDFAVETTADYAYGVHGKHYGSGALTIAMSGGAIDTEGRNAYGLHGRHYGSGVLVVAQSGGRIGTGRGGWSGADGVHAGHYGGGAVAIAKPHGAILTKGAYANGIEAFSFGSVEAPGDEAEAASSAVSIVLSGGASTRKVPSPAVSTDGRSARTMSRSTCPPTAPFPEIAAANPAQAATSPPASIPGVWPLTAFSASLVRRTNPRAGSPSTCRVAASGRKGCSRTASTGSMKARRGPSRSRCPGVASRRRGCSPTASTPPPPALSRSAYRAAGWRCRAMARTRSISGTRPARRA